MTIDRDFINDMETIELGRKRRASKSDLAESRELAATDGVVANGLNLAWIWTSPATNLPTERAIPALDVTPTRSRVREISFPAATLPPPAWDGTEHIITTTITNNNHHHHSCLWLWELSSKQYLLLKAFIQKHHHWVLPHCCTGAAGLTQTFQSSLAACLAPKQRFTTTQNKSWHSHRGESSSKPLPFGLC